MKKKISDLKIGDIVEIGGKYFDIYDTPNQLDNGEYIFVVVKHGDIERVHNSVYISPADLAYESSLNFDNEEINVVIKY